MASRHGLSGAHIRLILVALAILAVTVTLPSARAEKLQPTEVDQVPEETEETLADPLPGPPCGGNWSCYTTCCGASRFCSSASDVCCYENRHLCGSGETRVCVDVGCGLPSRNICGSYRYPTVDTCANMNWCYDAYQMDCYARHTCASGETPVCRTTSCAGTCATWRGCTDLCPNPASGLETDKMGLVTSTSLSLICAGTGCPSAPVTVIAAVSDTSQGEVRGPGGGSFGDSATLTFPAGSTGPIEIEIRGKDDGTDGDRPYLVVLTSTSADTRFNGKSISVSVKNIDRTDENACVPNVMAQFNNLPVSMNPLPIPFLYGTPMEYYCGDGCSSHFEGTNRARRDSYLMVTGTTGGASQLMAHRLWQKQGIAGPWGDNLNTWQDDYMANLYSYVVSRDWKHAGGLGIFGDFAAVPLEGDLPGSTVWFYDITRAYDTIRVGTELYRCPDYYHCFDNAGAVAVTKHQGKYLVAVMSNEPAGVHFYLSSGTDIRQPQTWTFLGTWLLTNHGYPYSCFGVPAGAATIQNMDFIKQCDGKLYMAAMYNTGVANCTGVGGDNRLRFYEVDVDEILTGDPDLALVEVGYKNFNCGYGGDAFCAFAGGAGIYVSPETRDMILYSQYWHTVLTPTHLGANTPFMYASEFPFCAVAKPTGVTASQGTYADRVAVTWPAVPGAASYTVLRNGVEIATTTGASYDDLTAPVCSMSTYTIKAQKCEHPSLASQAVDGWRSGLPGSGIPIAPPLVSPASGATLAPGFVRLDWDSVCLAQTYTVQVSAAPTFSPLTWSGTTTEPGTLAYAPLPKGGPYYWRVRGVTAQGVLGTWSATRTFDTNSLVDAVSLDAGYAHNLSAHGDGTVWSWGLNSQGQLGDGTTTNRNGPVRVQNLTSVVAVAGGVFHSAALKSDGTVWTWGGNADGQLGSGNTTPRSLPAQVSGLSNIVGIAAGGNHTLALKNDGTVWAWGDNWQGQIGDGSTIDRTSPVAVGGLSGVASLTAGALHSAALKTDGTVWTWGRNSEGELGDGGHTNRSTAGPVPGVGNVARISAGGYFNLALLTDGTLRGWGHNFYGQLGDGSNLERPSPVVVSGFGNVVGVVAGAGFSLALRGDGTVWSCGQNSYGMLGDGTTSNRNTFGQIAGLSSIVALAAGEDHAVAGDDVGRIFGWGRNTFGPVGTAPSPQLTPVVVTDESVTPPLGLIAPTGGEQWQPGTTQTVSWTGAGPINVDLSPDGGTTWISLAANTSQQDVAIVVPAGWTTARGRLRITRAGTPASSAMTGSYLRIAAPPYHPWLTQTLDNTPQITGEHSSIGVDPYGRTWIAYVDRTDGALKVAKREPSGWSIEVVDDENSAGWFPSLAFGSDGTPYVSYVEGTNVMIRLASRPGGVWQHEEITHASCTLRTSLALDTTDRPFIAVSDCGSTRIRLLADFDGWAEIDSFDGAYPSLVMQGDLPRISYFLHYTNPTELHYRWATPSGSSWTWSDQVVPGSGGALDNSLALDAQGVPSVSFYSSVTKSLRLSKKVNGSWSAAPAIVDASAGDVGAWNSLKLDASGQPRISYHANGLLKVAEMSGGIWQYDVVDDASDHGTATTLAIDGAGNDRIAYFDAANGNLRYAISTPDVTPPAAPALSGYAGRTTASASWTAPGDDGSAGAPAWSYDLRYSQGPIYEGNFDQAIRIQTFTPNFPGAGECGSIMNLNPCSPYYFALRVFDDAGNVSWVSDDVMVVTKCMPAAEVICP